MFITLTERGGNPIAIDPSTIRKIEPMQWLDESQPPNSPEAFPWGTYLTPKRDSQDHIVVRETFDMVMQTIENAK